MTHKTHTKIWQSMFTNLQQGLSASPSQATKYKLGLIIQKSHTLLAKKSHFVTISPLKANVFTPS